MVLLQVDVPATWLPNLDRKLNYKIENFTHVAIFFLKKKETCIYPFKQQFLLQQTTHYHMMSRLRVI